MPPFTAADSSPTATSDGGDEFLRRRLGLFGWLGAVCSLCFSLAFALSFALDPDRGIGAWLRTDNSYLDLLGAGAFFLLWLACRRRDLRRGALLTTDVLGFLVIGVATALSQIRAEISIHPVSTTLLATTLMIFRAVIVPSTARRTALIAVIAAVLAGIAIGLPARHPGVRFADDELRLGLMVWVFVGALVSTVISRTLYGLRRAVREARRLGQYRLEKRIGQGGMGEVYRASHGMLRRPTAVKVIRPDVVSEATIERFAREVRTTAALQHPNTVAIYDYGRSTDGVFYYAMEYLEGLTLEELGQRFGPQPPARVANILLQVCGSLEEAHSRGLVHRDIKPSNVFFTRRGGLPDLVKVMDFGLVHEMNGASASGDRADILAGTPAYMAPEVIPPRNDVGPASDLYALGAVAWFLLTGRPPFSGAEVREVLEHQRYTTPARPSELTPTTANPELESIVLRCLEKEPAKRPASARQLAESLTPLAASWTRSDAVAWWDAHQPELAETETEWSVDEALTDASTFLIARRTGD